MKELTFYEAVKIIKKDVEGVRNPRILEELLDTLGYGNKVKGGV